jgi:hypothetical protein
MTAMPTPATLNRPVFTQRSFESGALTVLTTLLHRFVDTGQYEVFIKRADAVIHRAAVSVAPEHGRQQVNLDMANVIESKRACGCEGDAAIELRTGGVLGFYVSTGTGRYSVTARNLEVKDRSYPTPLDSNQGVPAGDFFALTLVRPGVYRVTAKPGGEASVTVRVPADEQGYRPDRPTLVTVRKDGFNPKTIDIFSGQSVVFQIETAAQIRAELTKDEGGPPPLERTRASFRRPVTREREARRSESGDEKRRGKTKKK